MNCIILIGYRGVGKSTIAKAVAAKLECKQISLDTLLSEKIGNLQAFIKENGWEKFREEESELIEHLAYSNTVIDCGGGVVESEKNMNYLSALGTIFYLRASSQVIKERLITTNPRLSLSGTTVFNEIDEVLARRDPLYRKYADYVIDTTILSPDDSCEKIMSLYL
ncbi:MAG: hypothetical protein A2015_06435 [Spirochaetes bacterium GWF1_31_7]|nr:MAG: hypothetical protein A2Y30_08270 [Spirochaetes bacterium GWE1_32_154]OHD51382.1 MAG: hypothetical protein A2Y29_14655 [Spirochaetes bacterium GWE2_31_10]OHD53108.1 MAG: hypothetical protein A2015_06435 [Spirochaetes bacterium GWF1_31_7]HBD94471.1 hypothetical protein [Spirochaetia bacterium]HBI36116.1 hypothetical protein [Spirochaetia bacterium]